MTNFLKKYLIAHLMIIGCSSVTLNAIPISEVPKDVKEKWNKYNFDENGFSVEMPKAPEHVSQNIDVPKTNLTIHYDTYVSEVNQNAVYVVSVWKYPAQIDMSKPEVNLKDGFSGMLSALPGSKVMDMKVKDFQGFKSLEFLVQNEDIYFQGRLILVYNTLYQVFTVYKESEKEAMKKNYDKFMSSFKLIDPKKNKVDEADSEKLKMNVNL